MTTVVFHGYRSHLPASISEPVNGAETPTHMPRNIQRDGEGLQLTPYFEDSHPRSTLPVEVLDLVVDELGIETNQSSREALLSASLASRRLCMRAYKHIFSKLNLILVRASGDDAHVGGAETTHATLVRLRDTLIRGLEFPGLAMVYYLRSVSVTLKFNRRENIPLFDSFPNLPEILQALHGPTHGISCFRFEIDIKTKTGTVVIPPGFLSEKLNPKFSNTFHALCHSSQLKTLHLKHLGLFSTTLRGTHIENLHLREVWFEDDPEDPLGHHVYPGGCFIVQPTSMTLISTYRHRYLWDSSTYVNSNPKDLIGIEVMDPVDYFLPSYLSNKSLTHPQVFASLTTLTLMDRDRGCIQLDLIPNLQLLEVIQWLTFHTVSSFGYSTLHAFFKSQEGVIRNLGTTKRLTVETAIEFSRMFLNDNGRDEKGLSSSHLKPTRECWHDVDLDLTSASMELEHINFIFKFLLKPDEKLPSGYKELSFIADNKKLITSYFPHLSASPTFSMDVLVEKRNNPIITSGVEFRGFGAEHW